nr:uncharacterized protein LOC112742256 [Arachis hypogaea]
MDVYQAQMHTAGIDLAGGSGSTDFVVLDSDEDESDSIILGRPFFATARAIIDVEQGELTLRMHDESITLNVFPETQLIDEKKNCMETDKEDLQWKEGSNKTTSNHLPKQETDNTVRRKKNEMMQSDEGTQEEIEVLTTKKENPKTRSSHRRGGESREEKKGRRRTGVVGSRRRRHRRVLTKPWRKTTPLSCFTAEHVQPCHRRRICHHAAEEEKRKTRERGRASGERRSPRERSLLPPLPWLPCRRRGWVVTGGSRRCQRRRRGYRRLCRH